MAACVLVAAAGGLPDEASVHLDRGYDSNVTRRLLEDRGLLGVICEKGKPARLGAGLPWVVDRTNSRHNAHKKPYGAPSGGGG